MKYSFDKDYRYNSNSNSNSNKSCTLVIKGEENDLRELIKSLEKIGMRNDTQWNENRFNEHEKEYFILFHHFSDYHGCSTEATKITVFSSPNLYSPNLDTIVRLKSKSEIKEMVKTVNKFFDNKFKIKSDDEEKITIGGYEIQIEDKNTTTIAGFTFMKEFWESANIVSTHAKAKVKIGCNHQIDLDKETICKVLEMMKKWKKK